MGIPSPDRSYLAGLPRYLSFVDESGHSADPERNSLCLAGLIAAEDAWRVFDGDWRAACDEEHLTEPFHMMHFAARKGQFEGWSEDRRKRLLGKLIATIIKTRAIPIGSVVILKGSESVPEHVQKCVTASIRKQELTVDLEAIKQALNREEKIDGADLAVNKFTLQVI